MSLSSPTRGLQLYLGDNDDLLCVPLSEEQYSPSPEGWNVYVDGDRDPVLCGPWEVRFPDGCELDETAPCCIFSGNAPSPLNRTGDCASQNVPGTLDLSYKGITSLPGNVFAGMGNLG